MKIIFFTRFSNLSLKTVIVGLFLFNFLQAKSFFLETSGGLSFSQLKTTEDYTDYNRYENGPLGRFLRQDENSITQLRKGYNFGFGFGYEFTNHIALLIGLSQEEKGNRGLFTDATPDTFNFFIADWIGEWNLEYLTVPFLCQFSTSFLGGRPYLRFGAGFSQLISNKINTTVNGQSFHRYLDSLYMAELASGQDSLLYYILPSFMYSILPYYESIGFKKYDISLIGSIGYEYKFKKFSLFIESSISSGMLDIQAENGLSLMDGVPFIPKGIIRSLYYSTIKIGYKTYIY